MRPQSAPQCGVPHQTIKSAALQKWGIPWAAVFRLYHINPKTLWLAKNKSLTEMKEENKFEGFSDLACPTSALACGMLGPTHVNAQLPVHHWCIVGLLKMAATIKESDEDSRRKPDRPSLMNKLGGCSKLCEYALIWSIFYNIISHTPHVTSAPDDFSPSQPPHPPPQVQCWLVVCVCVCVSVGGGGGGRVVCVNNCVRDCSS